MFYKDDKGIDVIQLGAGDVSVSTLKIPGFDPVTISGICFGDNGTGKIGEDIPGNEGKFDYEFGVKLKLLFTDTKSIDVVIDALEKIKKDMKPKRRYFGKLRKA